MNSIAVIHAGKTRYYAELGRDDYYTGERDPRGTFMGEGAKELGIEGSQIEHKDQRLLQLFCGNSPDGKTTMRKGGGTVREYENKETGEVKKHRPVCAYDNTFSAPKDVSILYALAPEETRQQVLEIHNRAVAEAAKYLETQTYTRTKVSTDPERVAAIKTDTDAKVKANWQRVNKGEITKEEAIELNREVRNAAAEERKQIPVTFEHHECKGIFAAFTHTTSRELDPQLHTHLLILNTALREDGQGYGSVDGKRILEARYVAGQIYQNVLRYGLEKDLGVETFDRPFSDEKGMAFGINGVTQEVTEEFSTRSLQIRKNITPQMTGAQVRAEVLKERKTKQKNVDAKELSDEWRWRGTALGFDVKKVLNRRSGQTLTQQVVEKVKDKFVSEEKRQEAKEKELFRKIAAGLNRRSAYMAETKANEEKGKTPKEDKPSAMGEKAKDSRVVVAVGKEKQKGQEQREERDLTTFKRSTVMSAILRHDRFLATEEAEKLTDKFLDGYTAKQEIERQKKGISQGHEVIAEKDRKTTVHRLNEQGLSLAVERSKRESLLNTTRDILRWRKEAINRFEDWKQQNKQKNFNRRLGLLYYTGKISRKQYLQIKNNTQVEYSEFKLKVFEAVGIISHKQANYIRSQKELKDNPYYQINVMRKEGRISYDEAKELRLNQWKEDRKQEEALRITGEKEKLIEKGRERERTRGR